MTAPSIAKSGPCAIISLREGGRHKQGCRQSKVHDEGIEFADMVIVDGARSFGRRSEHHDRENGCQRHNDHVQHERAPVSHASMNNVIARRSADPPGLSRRATNDWCTMLARSRQ
jgi:hypothetical protein